ncbi:hypothetical protein SEUBUCD650_0P01150 [Saccharomyces eubayanus]|uniref:CAP-Gly domain-containing protein n=1 Tax=Saccharomyces eubayanus TaxID=1080349 RepID=A0ABN8VLD6_SACEU|nr:hypothetical protein SEUBUCD650_0P01150 [Saccharomyces eubayanus]
MHNARVQDNVHEQEICLQDWVWVNEMKGQVKFIGETKFAKGIWYGIELVKPLGKNDGSVKGIRYFFMDEAKNALNGAYYGLFCKREALQLYNLTYNANGMLRDDGTLQETIKELQTERELLISKLKEGESGKKKMAEYKAAIKRLSMSETDLLSKIYKLDRLVEALKFENNDMKIRLENFNKILNPPNEAVVPNANESALWERNRILQGMLEQTKMSYNENMKVQEELLEENTQLLEENAVLSKKISDLSSKLQQSNNMISDLTLQVEAQSKSSNIVERLTNDNVLLTSNLKALNVQLEELRTREKLDENLRITYVELEQELTLQLISMQSALEKKQNFADQCTEENERLNAMLKSSESQATHKFQSLELKVNTLQEELYQNKLLKSLYKMYEPFTQQNMWALSSQLQYLAEVIDGENIRSSPIENIEAYTILTVLSYISYALYTHSLENAIKNLGTITQSFKVNNVQLSMWQSEFLQRKFSPKQEIISSINSFLKENKFLDNDVTLILKTLHSIFEIITPKLLAVLKDSTNSNEDDGLSLISSLYEASFSVTANIDTFLEKNEASGENKTLLLSPACDLTLSSILSTYFSNPVFLNQDFERLRACAIEELTTFFSRIEDLLENKIVFTEHVSQSSADAEDTNDSTEEKSPNSLVSGRLDAENIYLKEELLQKENLLTELKTKIEVISGRDSERKNLERIITGLQKELNDKNEENRCHSEMLSELKDENTNLRSCLKNMELDLYQVEGNNNLNRMCLDREKVDRMNLVSEIMGLRETIKRQLKDTKPATIDLSWLEESPSLKNEGRSKGDIHRGLNIYRIEMADSVNNSRVLDLNSGHSLKGDEVSYEIDCSYIAYLKHKRKNIRLKLQNIVTKKE